MTDMEGYKQNAQGALVPVSKIKSIDLLRDEVVGELIGKAKDMHQLLAHFKEDALDSVRAFVEISAERYGTNLGGKKGNLTLRSFDGKARVLVAIADRIVFDERLQVAKALIDECIHRWSDGGNDNIRVLVNDAFQVDRQGNINTSRILSLRRLEIRDAKWHEAMRAISDSVTVASTKEYMRFYVTDETGKEQQISLDLAAV